MRPPEPNNVLRLWRHLTPKRRGQFRLVLVLMVLASFSEMFTIGAVVPFLAALASPGRLYAEPVARPFIEALHITSPGQLLLPLTLIFACGAIAAGGMRLSVLWATSRISFATGADISIDIYRRTLHQPYSVHVARNSSEVIGGIVTKAASVIVGTLLPVLTMFGSALIVVTIVATLIAIEPTTALLALGGFGTFYGLITLVVRRRLARSGEEVARQQTEVVKCLQEGLGGIRDVLIDGSQSSYSEIYRRADHLSRRAQASITFVSNSPRFGVEALGMVLIAGLALNLSRNAGGLATSIPVLGALALGAQALLPALQAAYLSWSTLKANDATLRDTLQLLDQPLPEHAGRPNPEPIPFERGIDLVDVGFRYAPDGPWVLRHVDLHIPRGARIGFQGTTGGGKSTLLDIVMALLDPTEGRLLVDGCPVTEHNRRAWQVRIAHVPQSIYLADSTIAENVAFGVPVENIDMERVRSAARRAQIADLVATLPDGYAARVGERGVRLSGGQRQRIGIARALYKQATVIIFDEATSALDNQTEQAVMDAIESLGRDLTLLIVAHRLSTLRGCDEVLEVSEQGLRRVGAPVQGG
jgi:ABC-type multidrug transport system fused ATPase/permease subunit